MADSGQNRTEQATPKRKADARAKGQVALSRDAAMAVGLLGSLGALYWMTPGILNGLRESLQLWLSKSMEEATQRTLSLDHLHLILRQIGVDVFVMLGPVIAGIAVVGVGANLIQTGFLWKRDALQLEFSRISPMAGFSRLFSVRSFSELVKSWLKIFAIGGVGYLTIKQDMLLFSPLTQFGMETLLPTVGWATFKAALMMGGAALVIGGLDYGFQRFEWERDLRISRSWRSSIAGARNSATASAICASPASICSGVTDPKKGSKACGMSGVGPDGMQSISNELGVEVRAGIRSVMIAAVCAARSRGECQARLNGTPPSRSAMARACRWPLGESGPSGSPCSASCCSP